MMNAITSLNKLKPSGASTLDVAALKKKCYEALDDDLNTPVLLSHLFEGVKYINSVNDGTENLNNTDLEALKNTFTLFVNEILGLKDEITTKGDDKLTGELVNVILNLRQDAKIRKEWGVSDKIRDELNKLGITIKDRKDGVDWER